MDTFCALFIIALSCSNVNGQDAAVNTRYYPKYHLAAPFGWINDPNGFCIFQNEYHLFYQYNPESSLGPGTAHWGHAKSNDLFHWVDLPIALSPTEPYDDGGVFSGSAIVEDNVMYLFYTGNVNYPGQTPDHGQVQALATSTDGIHVVKSPENPIIRGENFQPDIRDPKVWKHGNYYYMVVGNSFADGTLGRVLLYRSSDRITWDQVSILGESDGFLGYMWECPDFFEIDGRFVLLFSPQGMAAQGDKYKNIYQTGYIVGYFNYTDNLFSPISEFQELDFGHDFYATQTILDHLGRRLLVAWMNTWAPVYPEREDGWAGMMTIIRDLSLTADNKLIQRPVSEVAEARGKALFAGNSRGGTVVTLTDNAGEIFITAPRTSDFILYVESDVATETVTIRYEFLSGRVSLDRGGNDGLRRTKYRPLEKLKLRVYIDRSSIELFFGEGEVTFSSRFFPTGSVRVRLGSASVAEVLIVSEMKTTLYVTS